MPAQSWTITVSTETGKNEKHGVFATDSDHARTKLQERGYTVINVTKGPLLANVNKSAETKLNQVQNETQRYPLEK